MGLAVLPARLKNELKVLGDKIVRGESLRDDPAVSLHADWAEEFLKHYDHVTEENIDRILKDEVGKVFAEVLEHAGVYKRTEEGKAAFLRFVSSVR